jgi:DNA-binding winged helix-turn-helix (wHTH) protein
MTRIASQIRRSSSKWSGISTAVAMPRRPPSSLEKKTGLLISRATTECAVRTNQPNTTCTTANAVARFGRILVDFSGAEAYRDGVKVPLTAHEFKVLRYFVNNPGRVICRHELLDKVWGYNAYPTTRTVDNQILKLRQKLELDPKSPSHFVTVHGIGYKFVHDDFESGAPARLQSLQASIRRNTGREGECDGADLRNIILGYLSGVYEILARDYPQGLMPHAGAKQSMCATIHCQEGEIDHGPAIEGKESDRYGRNGRDRRGDRSCAG